MIRGIILTSALVFSFGALALADDPATADKTNAPAEVPMPDSAAKIVTIRVSTTDPSKIEYRLDDGGLMNSCATKETLWIPLEDKIVVDSEAMEPTADNSIYFVKELKKEGTDVQEPKVQLAALTHAAGRSHFYHHYDGGHYRYQPYFYSNPDSFYYEPCGLSVGIGPFSYYSYCR